MTTTITTELRLTCSIVSRRNDQGKEKLVAGLTTDADPTGAGLWVWCRSCKAPYFVSREACIAAWERGKTVVKGCGHQ